MLTASSFLVPPKGAGILQGLVASVIGLLMLLIPIAAFEELADAVGDGGVACGVVLLEAYCFAGCFLWVSFSCFFFRLSPFSFVAKRNKSTRWAAKVELLKPFAKANKLALWAQTAFAF